MEIIKNCDVFLDKQPKLKFETLLCTPLHNNNSIKFTRKLKNKNEIDFSVINFKTTFIDKEHLLDYAYEDFKKFLSFAKIEQSKKGKNIEILPIKTNNVEEFTIEVTESSCKIFAGFTEGVRRALIFIEDEMVRRDGPFLPKGVKTIKPYVKTRISRCFFTPPSHASAENSVNELMSDIDYYPDEYLNRLAHDGINGLWIGTSFRKMLKSSIFPEFGFEEEQQVKKLNGVIAKCKKFGIGIYLFVTEPASSCYTKELYNHLDLVGCKTGDGFLLPCPSNEKIKKYIEEAVTRLFTLVPDLAGIINISVGESLSGCGSTSELICPACKKKYKTLAKTLTATEKMFADAMKKISPKAKFISWTYENRSTRPSDVDEECMLRDKNVYHMQNFEDLGRPKQLGKKRLAYDYWLSYAGPGKLMRRTVKNNKKRNINTFAKIQVCSSHEISTVPYVPVPGILYDKYKFMNKNNISGVLQCWYFGNYPSIMNKTAYLLSQTDFPKTKKQFLTYLAKTYYGKNYSNAVKAWHYFEKGYVNFPVNLAFEWVGPMQDSPCCPLHLKPIDWPMPGTWLKSEHTGGDRIGECLLHGHTIGEAITLTNRINKNFNKALKYMDNLRISPSSPLYEQLTNAKALSIIFKSGNNTLKFYKLRHLLGTTNCNQFKTLSKMKNIVKEEIENSKKLIPLSQKDIRIGYHSEANGYKIFPEKIEWRINELKKLLKTEFVEVEKRINTKKVPLDFYFGNNKGSKKEKIQTVNEKPKWKNFVLENGKKDLNTKLRVYEKSGKCFIEILTNNINCDFLIKPEFNLMFPHIPLHVINGKFIIQTSNAFSIPKDKLKTVYKNFDYSITEENNNYKILISFKRKKLSMKKNETFRLAVWKKEKDVVISTLLQAKHCFASQLIRGEFSPENYCFFVK